MRALDGAVGNACVNAKTPGIAVRENHHGKLEFLVHAFQDAPGASCRLSLQMHKDGVEFLIKSVLDEPVLHTACLDGNNELRVMFHELYGLHVIWYLVCLLYTSDAADDLLCVDLG